MLKSKLLLIACVFVFFAGAPKGGYQVGDSVDDFELKSVEGEMVSLADYEDAKGFILIFDCNTCPYSKAYLERIKELHAKYESKGYPVVAIQPNDPGRSPGDSFDEMVSYAKKNNYKHAYLYDDTQEVAKKFGATNTPHVYVLNKDDGNLVVNYIGAIDNNTRSAADADKKYVEDAVDALLKGKKPEVTKTKAIGCTIKWKAA
ncbi:thioredoxin family protein [Fulvivirga sp. RKSG066]|uniref:thioredoxin family protein n=1 Tax=Fulvivirga aurantia TaxID=2529383 RepID=UPI0012BB8428|nr:thioredoxin family protein [Fulvivirga aurantia]MTI21221.1 thioredoxin family protein [Fulvivirga aurantia]